ncbi:MAG TPA: hypothetical protein DCX53_08880 [Anaerolineae bacterium]|nr:hypothetical protein [Anaerolineae bacterium]
MRQQYIARSTVLAVGLLVVSIAIIVQMFRIQNSEAAKLFLSQGDLYAGEFQMFHPERGEIYDRQGHLLAGNRTVYEVGVSLNDMKDVDAMAYVLGTYMDMTFEEVYDKLTDSPESWTYIVIKDYVDAETVTALQEVLQQLEDAEDNRLDGLGFKPHYQRSYPEQNLASNVLGFVTRDGRGYFGIEEKYNDLLAGNPVQVWVPRDPNKAIDIPKVPNGTTLVLTLNRDLQAKVENILDESLIEYGAKNGAIIVMDPQTGEILAMATTPRMNLNNYTDYFQVYDNGSQYNRSIGMAYEAGSVVKVLTMAAALDTGAVTPQTSFVDTGSINVGGITIQNWDRQAWGQQDMTGCLQHSLNVCMAWIATQMGSPTFYSYMEHFGLGHPTGVDLSGEAMGRLKVPGDSDWYPVDLGTNAFGQGVTVTPMQMLMAVSAIANDGKMVTPHMLYAMLRDGHQYNVPSQYAGSPISEQTARTLTQMLTVSLESESSLALLPGYRVAGKTGTARKAGVGGYSERRYQAVFAGYVPASRPRLVAVVVIDEPSAGAYYGGAVAAPVFARIMAGALRLMEIPPDDLPDGTGLVHSAASPEELG